MTRTSGAIGFSRDAADKWAGDKGVFASRLGNVGVRIFGGRMANPKALASGASAGRTYEVVTTTPLPFGAMRLILAVGQTAGADAITPSVIASAAPVPDLTDASIPGAAWTQMGFGGTDDVDGGSTIALAPAASNKRRKLYLSDIMPISSVPRTDGGAYPAIRLRIYVFTTGAAGNYVVMGNGVQDFSNWATHPSGRIWKTNGKYGQFVGPGAGLEANMTDANSIAENGSPIVGLVYYARGKVVNVVGFGDSITEGQGTYIGEGFGFPACHELSRAAEGIAYEWSNLGWAGQTMGQMRQNIIDAMTVSGLKFDVALIPGASPNGTSAPIQASDIDTHRFVSRHSAAILRDNGVTPLISTWLPTNPGIKDYNASDSLRRALNDDYRSDAGHGAVVPDFDAALAGATDGDGQTNMLVGTTDDNIHPNDMGNALLATVAKAAIRRIIGPPAGSLVVP